MAINIRNFVDLNEFQRIQDLFSDATGLAAISTDAEGNYITNGSNFTDFCMKYTRGNPEGLKRCEKCDKEGKGTYFCHAGLMDFASDILVNGEKVASIIGGQVLPKEPDIEKFRLIARELGIDENAYLKALNKVPVHPEKTIRAAAELLATIMNQWVNLMYFRKFNEKKLDVFHQESEKIQEAVHNIKLRTQNLRQTATMENILSLNAAIEAKRAGKAGVGFTVVAEEIGNLSKQSSAVYEEIHSLTLQVETSVEAMEKIDL